MNWLDVLGWVGSVLLVWSLMQSRVLRFRIINLVGCVVLLVFNFALDIWPMVAVNAVLSGINVWFIVNLLRHRHDRDVYTVLPVGSRDAYLTHVLAQHAADIAKHQPDFVAARPGTSAYLVQKGDETVGVVVLRVRGAEALIDLDFVTPRYRDFSPGEFVWRESELLRQLEVDRVVAPVGPGDGYYRHLGFRREADTWVLDV